jgi:hypothetical protein
MRAIASIHAEADTNSDRPLETAGMPSSCSPSSQPLRGRFAQGECFAFAGLDRSARRWPLAHHVVLVSEEASQGRFRSPKRHGKQYAAPTRRGHPKGRSAAKERPLGRLTAARRRGPSPNDAPTEQLRNKPGHEAQGLWRCRAPCTLQFPRKAPPTKGEGETALAFSSVGGADSQLPILIAKPPAPGDRRRGSRSRRRRSSPCRPGPVCPKQGSCL